MAILHAYDEDPCPTAPGGVHVGRRSGHMWLCKFCGAALREYYGTR